MKRGTLREHGFRPGEPFVWYGRFDVPSLIGRTVRFEPIVPRGSLRLVDHVSGLESFVSWRPDVAFWAERL